MLLCSSDIRAGRQVCDDLLACPAAFQNGCPGVGHSPFQILDQTFIGRFLPKVGRVLEVNDPVRTR